MFVKLLKAAGAGALLASLLVTPSWAQKTKLTVYTALENDQLAPFKAEIEKAVPSVDIEWVRDSTGVITARFLAEKDNPKADMIMGLAASSLLAFKKAGLLEAYQPKGVEALRPAFRSQDGSWTAHDAYVGIICFNTAEAQKLGLAAPKSWQDLTDSKYKDKLVMPHPASSGTGYLTVAAWLQLMGEAEAWKFMDALHQNMAVYTHSGSAPCVQAAKGERVAGIALDMRGARENTAGAPLEVIAPVEGVGWDMEAYAIVKGGKKLDIAKQVADWAASKAANELYAKYYAIVAHPEVKNVPKNYPAEAEARMAKIDFQKMADERERVLMEWSKRYEAKAAPKN
jgi:iron(III) transport system substrate-binding protein